MISIRQAHPDDSVDLTELSFLSKKHWNYPEKYFEIWRDELTITPEYIGKNRVFVAEREGEKVGYYSIVHNPNDFYKNTKSREKMAPASRRGGCDT